MSLVFEPQDVFNPGSYSDMDEHVDTTQDVDRFPESSDPVVAELAHVQQYHPGAPPSPFMTPEARLDMTPHLESPASLPNESSPTPSRPSTSHRAKNVPKPEREATCTEDGKFVCNWPSCKDDVRAFTRRCEWSKHMDKHDRPYKCAEEGCQKLPGFTYSGGLLRHEREVHNRHGGPKNSFHCPHATCKRHMGKGFSRLENLNEHLRRVHTPNGGGRVDGVDSDGAISLSEPTTIRKRKRPAGPDDVREENKRLKMDMAKLREHVEAQNHQMLALMQQIGQLQAEAEARGDAVMVVTMPPSAPMQAMMAAGSNI